MTVETMKKKSQNSIAKSAKLKPESDLKDWKYYSDYYSQKFVPEPCLERLAEKILRIINENKEIKTFNKVLALCGTNPWTLTRFMKRSEKLKEAKKKALFILGARREEMALEKKLEVSVFRHMQGRYDKDWKDQEEYFNELKQKIASKAKDGEKEMMLDAIKEIMKPV